MPEIPIRRKHGGRSYPAAETIVGGQLVEGRAASRAGVAAAGSFKVLGVARNDAVAALITDPVNGILDTAPTGTLVGVEKNVEVPVKYAAAAAFGDKLIAASLGRVTPAGVAPDARTIVGECTQVSGVTVVDSVALAWIY